jgi:hypothetical protein
VAVHTEHRHPGVGRHCGTQAAEDRNHHK